MSTPFTRLRLLLQLVTVGWLFCLLPAAVRAEAPPATYRIVDATPTFWRYWEQARGLDQAEQVRRFLEQVVTAYPELYTAQVLGLDEKRPFKEEFAKRYPKYFQFVSPHFDTMRRLSEELQQKLPLYDAHFRREFPDMSYTGEVYFLNSLGAFDGATRQVMGKTALLFGVDMIAAIYGPTADVEPFFDHELFHIYHSQFPDPGAEDTLARALWREGLATYVAQALNPSVSERILFGLPEDMPARARQLLPKLAAELRSKLDSKDPDEYAAFFLGNGARKDIPARSGYFVGYQVARELARTRTLAQLAQLRDPELRTAIADALSRLESPPSPRTRAAPDPRAPMMLDTFDDLTPWRVAASDGVSVSKAPTPGAQGGALRLSFNLGPSAGYAFAHRDLPLDPPDNFEITFLVRGEAAPNNLEFKLTDTTGDNVWWHVRRDFQLNREWREVRIKKRQISFAWGPIADKTLRHTAGMEFVISAGSGGGAGWIEIDQLAIRRLPVESGDLPPITARATSANDLAPLAVDNDPATAWRSPASTHSPQELTLDLGRMREFGGLSLLWSPGAHARDYDIELSDEGINWRPLRRVRGGDGGEDSIMATESEARFIRIRMQSPSGQGFGLADIRIEPLQFGADANAFLTALAHRSPRGLYPRGFAGEQSYWTLIGIKGGGDGALVSEDGALEIGRGGISIEPFVTDGTGITSWADATIAHRLADNHLPIPSVEWTRPSWQLTVTAFVAGERGNDRLVGRYTLKNLTDAPLSLRLALVVRPLQVNPPTQFLTTPGGVSPIRTMAWDGTTMSADARRIFPLQSPDMAGVSTFDGGAYPQRLLRADAAGERAVEDETGLASGVLAYDVVLPPRGERRLGIVAPLTGRGPDRPRTAPDNWLDEEEARVAAFWRKELSTAVVDASGGGYEVTNALRSSLAHMLIMQDGAILRPGARSYARSWIRDGAMIAEALLRLGHSEEAKAYLRWYAAHLFSNGKVPCCVDARGADPVPENDSHGEFIHLAAEIWRYTGDRALLQSVWPKVEAAAQYMNQQRLAERPPSQPTEPERSNLYGLMPPSISHEGYSSKPAYSYWDDFWTLRGFEDAAMLAATFSDPKTRARLAAQRDEFRADLMTSLRMTARRFNIPYIAGAADLGDFDATSTTIALSPGGLRRQLPSDLLEETFNRYWQNFTSRRDGAISWKDYTPYEWRVVGAFVRLGSRDRARQALDFFMNDRRPLAWNQWAEVVGREPREPRFIGDMPHGWVASDFVRSALDLFVYERRDDNALVLAAGVPESWLRDNGVRIESLRTPWGTLSLTMQAAGDRLTIRLQGTARPPGGFIIPADLFGPSDAVIDGHRTKWTGTDLKVARAPATIVLTHRKEAP